jgi:cysteinyl-tRNA synthetase
MHDDLNISAALAVLFTVIKRINTLIDRGEIDPDGAGRILETLERIDTVLNVFDFSDETENPEVQRLIEARNSARQARDWERADRLRDQLLEMGVVPRDEPIR